MNPITISKIDGNGVSLFAKTPFSLTPKYDEDQGHWWVELDDIDLYCYGEDEADLMECIHDFISYDWISYAICDDDELDTATLDIKKALNNRFIQIP